SIGMALRPPRPWFISPSRKSRTARLSTGWSRSPTPNTAPDPQPETFMYGTVMYAPGDVRYDQIAEPKSLKPTDAIIKLAATCVCGSDLWPYRGASPLDGPTNMGHEYCGVVTEVGSAVKDIKIGQFV